MKTGNLLNSVLQSMTLGYQKQLIKYEAMYELAEKQKENIEKNQWSKLSEIIEERQLLLNQLKEMNEKIKPLRNDIVKFLNLKEFSSKAVLEAVPTKAAQELADTIAKIGEILHEIKILDDLNEKLLCGKLANLQVQMESGKNMGQAIRAYKKANKKQH